jgi:hypothetical protein
MHAEPLLIPDEEEQAVTPGDDSNDDPTPPLPVDPTGAPSRNPAVDSASSSFTSSAPLKKEDAEEETKEEPEIGNERDIPSDGRDPEGEGMIREVEKTTGPTPPERP